MVNDVKAARAFRTVTLLFRITRFFNIGCIGEVCSNIDFALQGYLISIADLCFFILFKSMNPLELKMFSPSKEKVFIFVLLT